MSVPCQRNLNAYYQEDHESKRKGARSVAAYVQLSDALFTPYAESLYPVNELYPPRSVERETRSAAGWLGGFPAGGSDGYGGVGTGEAHRRRASGQGLEGVLGQGGSAGSDAVRALVYVFSYSP